MAYFFYLISVNYIVSFALSAPQIKEGAVLASYMKTVEFSDKHAIVRKPLLRREAGDACRKLGMILAEPTSMPLLHDVLMVGRTLAKMDWIVDDKMWIGLEFGQNRCWSWMSSGRCAEPQMVAWILNTTTNKINPEDEYHDYGLVLDLRIGEIVVGVIVKDQNQKYPLACQKANSLGELCLLEPTGSVYVGDVHHSSSGQPCSLWQSSYLESALNSSVQNLPLYFQDGVYIFSRNSCRNPDHSPDGPWCLVGSGDDIRRETCFIHRCHHFPSIQIGFMDNRLLNHRKIGKHAYEVTLPAGCQLKLSCQVNNTVEPVDFSWSLGARTLFTKTKMSFISKMNSSETNLTYLSAESNLTFIPTIEDNGKYLVCAVSWPQEMQIGTYLNVQYAPVFIGKKFVVKFVRKESRVVIRVYFLANPAPQQHQIVWSIGNVYFPTNKEKFSLVPHSPYSVTTQSRPTLYTAKLEIERVVSLPMHLNLEVSNELGSSGKFRIMLLESHNNDTSQPLIFQRLPQAWVNPALSVAVIFLISMVLAAIIITYVQSRGDFDPYVILRRPTVLTNNTNMNTLLKNPKKVNNSVQCMA